MINPKKSKFFDIFFLSKEKPKNHCIYNAIKIFQKTCLVFFLIII